MQSPPDFHSVTFAEHRPFLLSLAYRMLGSTAEAEDIVQECYLRWLNVSPEEVESPKAYLARIVTNQCINYWQSARVRREQYVGPWLPEPLLTAKAEDPVELSESLTMAFLVLLERLSPTERAVFLLSEVFDYSMEEIAQMVGKTAVNCRQLLHRARTAVALRRPRFAAQPEEAIPLLKSFEQAVSSGDLHGLISLLHPDATLMTDGGGKVKAALNPILGADHVARFFLGVTRRPEVASLEPVWAEINREPGLIFLHQVEIISTMVFHVEEGKIRSIFVTSNPEKLAEFAKQSGRDVTTAGSTLSRQ